MSKQFPGGIISKTPVTPSGPYETSTASGIWTLDQQAYWKKLGQWPIPGNVQPDAQFNYVTMLLHGDGTNGAQNNTFVDSSTNNFTITRNGNTTQGSFSPYGSNWSNNFNGSTGYLTAADNAALNFGTGDFTIEGWFYLASYNGASLIAKGVGGTSGYGLGIGSAGDKYSLYLTSLGEVIVSSSTAALNTWTHVAATRSGSTVRLFVNGVVVGTYTSSADLSSTEVQKIGLSRDGGSFFNGYISNVRIVKGTAVYTSAFTPSTAPLTAITNTSLLTCQSNRFIDNSTNNFTLTLNGSPSVQRFNPFGASTAYSTSVIGGSGYFDGSGDYLATSSTQIIPASTTYTVEAWVYLTGDYSDYREIVTQGSSGNANRWLMFVNITDGILKIQTGSTSITTSFTVPKNTWTHLAFVNNSGSYTVYANGTSVGSGSNSVTPQNTYVTVGAFQSGAEYFQGYISNVRITNTAVYTSAFTPNTAPLTAISGTSLLLLTTNAAIFDNAMMNNLETVGNAQISTSVVKYGTGSLAFDGTGDWLYSPDTLALACNTGDFTVEFWINPTNWSATYAGVVCGILTNSLWIGKNASNFVLRAANNTDLVSYGTMPTTGVWTHVAITRSGTTARMFYDGTQVASATTSHNFVASAFYVGQDGGSNALTGYIDDLRITKGYARYTANFTPPTAAFQNIGPN